MLTVNKHIRKRYKYVPFVLLSIVLAVLVYFFIASHSYSELVFASEKKLAPSQISYEVSDSDIISADIECRQASDGKYEYYLSVKPVNPGTASVEYKVGGVGDRLIMNSTGLGTIYEDEFLKFNGQEALLPAMLLIMLIVLVCFTHTFVEMFRAGDFSYSMAVLGGVILYLAGILIIITVYCVQEQVWVWMPLSFIGALLFYTGAIFPIVTAPAMLLLAAALFVSNIWLLRREGFRFQNLLSALLGFAIIAAYAAIMIFAVLPEQSGVILVRLSSAVQSIISYVLGYLECMLFSCMICAVLSTVYKPPFDKDYIIILGCAICSDGTPTPLLRGRIDRAIAFESEQFSKSGKHAFFVPSGGQGSDEVISEAESMKRYLMEQGIPEEQILPEDKSVNTLQNMEFSKTVIEKHGSGARGKKIAFSTTNYHVFRGYTMAHKASMHAHGLSAKTKLYFYPNALVREFIGLLYEQKKKHIAVVAEIIILITLYCITPYLL